MRPRLAGLLLLALALAAVPGPGGAGPASAASLSARSDVTIKVLTRSQRSLLRSRKLRVRLRAERPMRVTLRATASRTAKTASRRRPIRLARRRTVNLGGERSRTVSLRLTKAGRRALRACAGTRISVAGRVAVLRRRGPAFTGASPLVRGSAKLKRDSSRCRIDFLPTSISAGAASSDLTPPIGTPMFAYTARSGVANPTNSPTLALQVVSDPDSGLYAKSFVASRGIHTRVRARTIVLATRAGKFALVQTDLGGIPYAMVQEVQRQIASTGIRPDRVLIAATHTHSSTGPIWPADNGGYAVLGGDAFDPRVFSITATGIAESIKKADAALVPARVGFASTALHGASRNRNKDPFARNRDVPKDKKGLEATYINPTLNVIRVDTNDGRPLGVWSNFAQHQTSFGDGNLLFSGDNASFAERLAEDGIRSDAQARGRAPRGEVVNVWTNSAEGDISPRGSPDIEGLKPGEEPEEGPNRPKPEPLQYTPNSFTSAHLAGARVGAGILRAWREAGKAMRGELALDARRVFVDFDGSEAEGEPVGPLAVLGLGGIVGPDGACAPVDNFSGPGQGRKFPLFGGRPGLVPAVGPVSVWRVGPLGLAAFPQEITKQMGLRITNAVRSASGGAFSRVALVGLANGYQSYTSTPEEYDACHYEGSFTLFGRRQGPRYMNVARALGAAMFGLGPAPASAPEPESPQIGFVPPGDPDPTPDAGDVVAQPSGTVFRLRQAVFRWRGGNPQVDAPRGGTFVSLQRRGASGRFGTVATDDTFRDTVERGSDDVWTERFQFDECSPTGTYRFVVRGRADRGSGPAPYQVVSRAFELRRVRSIKSLDPVVQGGRVLVRANYPNPGRNILLALPRRVRSGRALLVVTTPSGRIKHVNASYSAARFGFVASIPAGSKVRVAHIQDRCGNSGR